MIEAEEKKEYCARCHRPLPRRTMDGYYRAIQDMALTFCDRGCADEFEDSGSRPDLERPIKLKRVEA